MCRGNSRGYSQHGGGMVPKSVQLLRALQNARSVRGWKKRWGDYSSFSGRSSSQVYSLGKTKGGAGETGGLGWLRRFKPGSRSILCWEFVHRLFCTSFLSLSLSLSPILGPVPFFRREKYSLRDISPFAFVLIRRRFMMLWCPLSFFSFCICPRAIVHKPSVKKNALCLILSVIRISFRNQIIRLVFFI